MRREVITAAAAFLLATTQACSAPDAAFITKCDPNAPLPSDLCRAEADAGSDAALDDAGPDAPGASPQANTCPARCAPVPAGPNAGGWTDIPLSLWVGPREFAPAKCPDGPGGVPNEKYRRFVDLDAPPAECEPCECEPSEGKCSGLPETIEVIAGMCGEIGAPVLPFGGPAGWDGSCTSANAVPAGMLCGGEPCAQYVWASPLPGPTNESCATKAGTPPFTKKTEWKLEAVACMANTNDDQCGTDAEKAYCVNDPGPGWLHCVYREGVHEQCPANYNNARWVTYPEKPIDDRGCESCSCGAPVGSQCVGSLRLYDDASCSSQFSQDGLASTKDQCVDIVPPGHVIGAKAITDVSYVQGSCGAAGGAPKGGAVPDPDPISAVTFCCLGSFYELK